MFLNLDAGEREDEAEALWMLADVLNCACGGHAGDAASMDRVAAFCARPAARLGAHPSYPDRVSFGRRSPLEALAGTASRTAAGAATLVLRHLRAAIVEQCAALRDVAARHGVVVHAVKPHGALYHDAVGRPQIAALVLEAAVDALGSGVLVIGPPSGALKDEATRRGLAYAREGFADRRLRADGTLVPRDEPDALILNPGDAARQAVALSPHVDTIGIHGDTPGALAIARAVREALDG